MKKKLNQKLINLIEYYNLVNSNYLFSNSPLNRISQKISATFSFSGTKAEKLGKLKKKIESIKNCELKKNASQIVDERDKKRII